MKSVFNFNPRAFLLSVTTAALLISPLSADCTYELFNISSIKGTSIGDFIDQISDECSMSVIIADSEAENTLKKQMNKTYLKNLTINEVLDLIIKENNLQYTLENNVLRISYLNTKTYNIDYIISQRKGEGSANITLSSQSSTASSIGSVGGASASGGAAGGASSKSGINITSSDEVLFWEMLDKEIESIINRPEDDYKAALPMINKNAGLITITATADQISRLDTYLNDLQKKMQSQVLIDVKMYSVIFSDASSTGIDWSQLYALQNVKLGFDYVNTKNIDAAGVTGSNSAVSKGGVLFNGFTANANNPSVFQLSGGASLNEVIKFLKTQGDVYSISNPKILTLNNQPALITAGTELFYSIDSSTTTAGGGTTPVVGQTTTVSSVFSGVLLDITPEISNDGTITLRVNPSISEAASEISTNNAERKMPPDLSRRQMSSVISVKDGSRVILGGLINSKNVLDGNKIPLLGDIPGLGYLFKSESKTKRTEEIVIIIEPHIIKKDNSNIALSDLGYSRLGSTIEKEQIRKDQEMRNDAEDVNEMKEDAK